MDAQLLANRQLSGHRMKGMGISEMAPVAIGFVVIAFVISMGSEIVQDLYDDQTNDSYAKNASGEGLESLSELGSWLPTLALVVVAAIIIGVLVTYLGGGGRRE